MCIRDRDGADGGLAHDRDGTFAYLSIHEANRGSRVGLGDPWVDGHVDEELREELLRVEPGTDDSGCLLYTFDADDERSSGDLGGGRLIKKKKNR